MAVPEKVMCMFLEYNVFDTCIGGGGLFVSHLISVIEVYCMHVHS